MRFLRRIRKASSFEEYLVVALSSVLFLWYVDPAKKCQGIFNAEVLSPCFRPLPLLYLLISKIRDESLKDAIGCDKE